MLSLLNDRLDVEDILDLRRTALFGLDGLSTWTTLRRFYDLLRAWCSCFVNGGGEVLGGNGGHSVGRVGMNKGFGGGFGGGECSWWVSRGTPFTPSSNPTVALSSIIVGRGNRVYTNDQKVDNFYLPVNISIPGISCSTLFSFIISTLIQFNLRRQWWIILLPQ